MTPLLLTFSFLILHFQVSPSNSFGFVARVHASQGKLSGDRVRYNQERRYSDSDSGSNEAIPTGFLIPFESNFYMQLNIGNPARPFNLKVDLDTSLTWIECEPCQECFVPNNLNRFNPNTSTTFNTMQCSNSSSLCTDNNNNNTRSSSLVCKSGSCAYNIVYDKTNRLFSSGDVVTDTLHVLKSINSLKETSPITDFVFGCGRTNRISDTDISGKVSLTTNKFSLISQLNITKFSHCFWNLESVTRNYIHFGSKSERISSRLSIPLLDIQGSYLYHVGLDAISVGPTSLTNIAHDYFARTKSKGSLVIDLGTYYSRVDEVVYYAIRDSLLRQIGETIVYEVNGFFCFSSLDTFKYDTLPRITLQFEQYNFTISNDGAYFGNNNTICAAFLKSENGGRNVIGASAMVNYAIGYDLVEKKVYFQPKDCMADFVDGL